MYNSKSTAVLKTFSYSHLNENPQLVVLKEKIIEDLKTEISLSTFPDSVLLRIFSYLNAQALCRVSRTCKNCNRIANTDEIWKTLYALLWPIRNIDDVACWKDKYRIATNGNFKAQPLIHSRLVQLQNSATSIHEKKRTWLSRFFHKSGSGYMQIPQTTEHNTSKNPKRPKKMPAIPILVLGTNTNFI